MKILLLLILLCVRTNVANDSGGKALLGISWFDRNEKGSEYNNYLMSSYKSLITEAMRKLKMNILENSSVIYTLSIVVYILVGYNILMGVYLFLIRRYMTRHCGLQANNAECLL